jgi:hypothetical protein
MIKKIEHLKKFVKKFAIMIIRHFECFEKKIVTQELYF